MLLALDPDREAEQWFTAPELHEALQLAETELLDAYVRDELAVDERRQVEENLLGSKSQRSKLAFAHALCASLRPARLPFAPDGSA